LKPYSLLFELTQQILKMATSSRSMSSISCVYWEWQRDDGGYSPYTPEQSYQIERACAAGHRNVPLAKHTVDLNRMSQISNYGPVQYSSWLFSYIGLHR